MQGTPLVGGQASSAMSPFLLYVPAFCRCTQEHLGRPAKSLFSLDTKRALLALVDVYISLLRSAGLKTSRRTVQGINSKLFLHR